MLRTGNRGIAVSRRQYRSVTVNSMAVLRFPKNHERRTMSTIVQFYQNRHLEAYAARETKRLTLRQLIFFGRSMTEERLVMSANYVRSELSVRIAHRLRDMQALPYVVMTQKELSEVYKLYWTAFEKFRTYPAIKDLEDNIKFCEFVKDLLNEHSAVIPRLSVGLSLSSHSLEPNVLDSFFHRMLISRISRRVLASHHIALSKDFIEGRSRAAGRARVGIIYTELSPLKCIERCAGLLEASPHAVLYNGPDRDQSKELVCPKVIIDGHLDIKFAYIREQFEYIIFELLKNAMYATSYVHRKASVLPEIRATIAVGEEEVSIRISDQGGGLMLPEINLPADLFSFSHTRNMMRLDNSRIGGLRLLGDSPRGLRATVEEQLARWQEESKKGDDPERKAGVGKHGRLGIGLPMSNIFATYFGGSLELVSLDGWGTDVHLKLPKLGTKLEGVEV